MYRDTRGVRLTKVREAKQQHGWGVVPAVIGHGRSVAEKAEAERCGIL